MKPEEKFENAKKWLAKLYTTKKVKNMFETMDGRCCTIGAARSALIAPSTGALLMCGVLNCARWGVFTKPINKKRDLVDLNDGTDLSLRQIRSLLIKHADRVFEKPVAKLIKKHYNKHSK